ncbi:MAG: Uncharacterized protein LiPW39_447 [Parcubacteria group bacterium LiPW_39]|nr:MAG: Uncharacterized protein LiPW39_447 [Parcubacteria group bacterium LiPW_39]
MFEKYLPKKFCKEYVEVRQSSRQLVMFMAVVLGIKPAMDDWVRKENYEAFKKICRRYGVLVKPDAAFFDLDASALKESVGGGTLTTTVAKGIPFELAKGSDLVHVFLAKNKDNLERAFGNGWYPLVIKNRVMQKPFIDLQKFGYDLGYPDCCVKFFRHFNDWYKFSHLYEIFKNTKGRPSYLCNCLTKDVVYSYIYHMPCSFNCRQTIKLADSLREAIKKEEPEFVAEIDKHTKLPFLVFNEIIMYAFEGEIKNDRLFYGKTYFVARGSGQENYYQSILDKGNCLFLEDKEVIVLKNKKLVGKIKVPKTAFAPQIPFLIQFV